MLKLSMKPTGWFQIGWSEEIRPGQAIPMKYFGKDLVAFRSESGSLSVLDAHCKHLGAHLGYGGKVRGDCVICPYHGWAWDSEGSNADVPYQDAPTKSKLGKYSITEQYGLIYLWHDPAGGLPRDDMTLVDVFNDFEHVEGAPGDYYPCYPDAVVNKPDEPIHPQLIQENAADSMHFRYAHGAPEDPELLWFTTENGRWSSGMGFKSPKTKEIALTLYTQNPSPGLSFAVFDGRRAHYQIASQGELFSQARSAFARGDAPGNPRFRRVYRRIVRGRCPHVAAPALHAEPCLCEPGHQGLHRAAQMERAVL